MRGMFRFPIIVAAFALALIGNLSGVTTGQAADCSAQAAKIASQTGGRVLSVKARGRSCHIKVLVKSGNAPPRTRKFVVRM